MRIFKKPLLNVRERAGEGRVPLRTFEMYRSIFVMYRSRIDLRSSDVSIFLSDVSICSFGMYRSFLSDVSICTRSMYRSILWHVSISLSLPIDLFRRKYRSILSDLSISLSLPIGLAQPLARGLIFRQNCDRGRPRRRLYSRTSTSSQQLEGPLSRE